MYKTLIFLTFILLLAAGWIGLQRISAQDERSRLEQIQTTLQAEEKEIADLESALENQAGKLADVEHNLAALQVEILAFEEDHPGGIPESRYAAYKQQVDRYNALAVMYNNTLESYNSIFRDYSAQVEDYNRLVGEANALASAIGSTWTVNPRGVIAAP